MLEQVRVPVRPLRRAGAAVLGVPGSAWRGLVAGSWRTRRESREAARRSRPSSSSSSASVAIMVATARPVGVPVSTPSRNARNRIRRWPRSAMVRVTSTTDRPEPIDGGYHYGVTLAGIVKQGRQTWPIGVHRTGEFVGEDMTGFDPLGGERGELRIKVLARECLPARTRESPSQHHCRIAHRQRGSETRGVRREMRRRHLGLCDGGVVPVSGVSFL